MVDYNGNPDVHQNNPETEQNFYSRVLQSNLDKIPEIGKEILLTDGKLQTWCSINYSAFKSTNPSDVSKFLIIAATQLINKKVPLYLVKNVYNIYSVIFAILINQKSIIENKSLYNKLAKVFYDTLRGSNAFDIYYKKQNIKYARTIVALNDKPVELYWLIPCLINPQIFKMLDTNDLINSNLELLKFVEDFKSGYDYFVENFATFDKSNYKQFLADAIQTLNKLKAQNG